MKSQRNTTAPAAQWRDISSFSRTDTDHTPKSWALEAGLFTVHVHRHRHYEPTQWLLSCDPLFKLHVLASEDVEAAKQEALGLVAEQLRTALAALPS